MVVILFIKIDSCLLAKALVILENSVLADTAALAKISKVGSNLQMPTFQHMYVKN